MIIGILSLSNGVGMNYPFPPVIHNLSSLCDKVLVGLDPAFPADFVAVEALIKSGMSNVNIIPSPWNKENIKDGSEIAIQMDVLVGTALLACADWVVVPQADEMFLNDDFEMLRAFMERVPDSVIGFSVERLYFWKDFDTIRKDWNAKMVRIFRPRAFSFMAEGTDKAGMYSGPLIQGTVVDLPYKLYHYSRMGDPKDISMRIRNLDGFFHSAEALVPQGQQPEYDFVPRKYDNYAVTGMPDKIAGEFEIYKGKHPEGIKEWFGNV